MPGGVNEWVSLIINLICTWIAVDFMDKGFQPKYSGRKRAAAWFFASAAYFLLLTFLNYLTEFEGIMGLSYGLPLFIYGITSLKGSKREMAAMSAAWVLIAFLGYYITASAVRMLTGRSLDNLYETRFHVYQYSMTAVILRLVMAKLVLAAKKKMSGGSGGEELILAGAFTAIFLEANGIVMLDSGNLGQAGKNLLSFGLLPVLLAIIASLVYFYHRLDRKNKEKLMEEYDRLQLQQQREKLEQLNQMCSELGSFRHDLTGMLDTVSGMLQNRRYKEAGLCLDRMDRRLKDCSLPVKATGNEGLDMALLRTTKTCREQGIDFHYAVGGNIRNFDPLDMGILFFNLLGNAVEACARQTHKENTEIILHIWQKAGGIVCHLENTIEHSVLDGNPALQSQKEEKLRHGFGLKSIRSIVEGCGGSYRVWEEDGMFLQEIRVPVPIAGPGCSC